jgi:hypothetical protein
MNIDRIVGIAGLVLGIIGLVLTIRGGKKAIEKKDPRIYCSHFEKIAIAKNPVSEMQILFRGQAVNRITTTLLFFWNAGARAILRSDIPAAQPLRVQLSETEGPPVILDVAVRRVSRSSVHFSASRCTDDEIELAFDFLDQGDGALVEIQHTGTPFVRVSASGVVLGAVRGVRMMEPFSRLFAAYPGGTLMFRLGQPRKDRALRVTVSLFWIAALAYWSWKTWGVQAEETGPASIIVLLLGLFLVYRSIVAFSRPMYSIPNSIRPEPPSPPVASASA